MFETVTLDTLTLACLIGIPALLLFGIGAGIGYYTAQKDNEQD